MNIRDDIQLSLLPTHKLTPMPSATYPYLILPWFKPSPNFYFPPELLFLNQFFYLYCYHNPTTNPSLTSTLTIAIINLILEGFCHDRMLFWLVVT